MQDDDIERNGSDTPPQDGGRPVDDSSAPDADDRVWAQKGVAGDSWYTNASSGGSTPVALAVACLAGALTMLVAVLVWGSVTGDDGASATDDGALAGAAAGESLQLTAPDDSAAAAPPARSTPPRLARCASAQRDLEGTLAAAQPALDQWAIHVGAMNKLVVGEITLQQASAFWNRTRVGAQRRVHEFHGVMDELEQRGVDCPGPELLAPGRAALQPCARQVAAQVRALDKARTSITTWGQHIHHMDMMRLGELSPEKATAMWLSMWRDGTRDLDAYQLAAQEAGAEDGCASAPTSG